MSSHAYLPYAQQAIDSPNPAAKYKASDFDLLLADLEKDASPAHISQGTPGVYAPCGAVDVEYHVHTRASVHYPHGHDHQEYGHRHVHEHEHDSFTYHGSQSNAVLDARYLTQAVQEQAVPELTTSSEDEPLSFSDELVKAETEYAPYHQDVAVVGVDNGHGEVGDQDYQYRSHTHPHPVYHEPNEHTGIYDGLASDTEQYTHELTGPANEYADDDYDPEELHVLTGASDHRGSLLAAPPQSIHYGHAGSVVESPEPEEEQEDDPELPVTPRAVLHSDLSSYAVDEIQDDYGSPEMYDDDDGMDDSQYDPSLEDEGPRRYSRRLHHLRPSRAALKEAAARTKTIFLPTPAFAESNKEAGSFMFLNFRKRGAWTRIKPGQRFRD